MEARTSRGCGDDADARCLERAEACVKPACPGRARHAPPARSLERAVAHLSAYRNDAPNVRGAAG